MFVVSAAARSACCAGGALTEALDWHWIFFINLPIGVAAFVLGRALIEESPAPGLQRGVDWLGALLMTGATMLVVYAIVTAAEYGWGSAHTLGFGGGAGSRCWPLRGARGAAARTRSSRRGSCACAG